MTLVSFLNIDENELHSFQFSYSDIDECTRKLDRCQEDASCTNTKGSYNCSCDAGYSGDGFNCSGMDMKKIKSLCSIIFYFKLTERSFLLLQI